MSSERTIITPAHRENPNHYGVLLALRLALPDLFGTDDNSVFAEAKEDRYLAFCEPDYSPPMDKRPDELTAVGSVYCVQDNEQEPWGWTLKVGPWYVDKRRVIGWNASYTLHRGWQKTLFVNWRGRMGEPSDSVFLNFVHGALTLRVFPDHVLLRRLLRDPREIPYPCGGDIGQKLASIKSLDGEQFVNVEEVRPGVCKVSYKGFPDSDSLVASVTLPRSILPTAYR